MVFDADCQATAEEKMAKAARRASTAREREDIGVAPAAGVNRGGRAL